MFNGKALPSGIALAGVGAGLGARVGAGLQHRSRAWSLELEFRAGVLVLQ